MASATPLYVLAAGALILGAILGSFLNAFIFRFNTGGGFFKEMSGRSHCMRCGHTLGSLDLVPILSYFFLGGHCRYCGSSVSLQYPLVEIAAATLSLKLFLLYPFDLLHYAFWLIVWLTVLFIVVYDWRHMIIPWSSSLFLLALAVISLAIGSHDIWSLAAGPLLALPLFCISLVSMGRWMGWADSLFELSLGAFLGLSMGATALLFAIWSGALVGLILILLQKLSPESRSRRGERGFTIKSEIPFAPFLALGAAIVFFLHVDFFSSLILLF